jgi:hypothetical protein
VSERTWVISVVASSTCTADEVSRLPRHVVIVSVEPADAEPRIFSGMPCPACGVGKLRVYDSHESPRGAFNVRRFKCKQCGHLPKRNVQLVPRENI